VSASPRLLEVAGLTVRFGGLVALDGVDVGVAKGETVGVIGPNGSGKTTFFNALTGLLVPAAGEIVFLGRRLAGLEAHAIARLGIARTFQASRLCLALSVFDNILIGMHAGRRTGVVDFVVRRGRFLGEMRTASSACPTCSPCSTATCRGAASSAWASSRRSTDGASRSAGRSPPSRNCSCSTSRRPG